MNTQFRMDSISVENFRCFASMESPLLLHPGMTVLVARNGEGKTAILDAVKISLGTFSQAFPISAVSGLRRQDVHISSSRADGLLGAVYPARITATGMIGGRKAEWKRELRKASGRTTTRDARVLSDYGASLLDESRQEASEVVFPLIAYYGTGRLWGDSSEGDVGRANLLSQSRFAGYENALAARSTYRQVRSWLVDALLTDGLREARISRTGRFVRTQLEAVRAALRQVLAHEGLTDMHYDGFFKDDVTVFQNLLDDDSRPRDPAATAMPVSWLSDGVRAVFAMVADIAFRCVKLNPNLGAEACRRTCGIVLVDEVDIFLHPAWQQHILSDLRQAFPCIQFVVSTHSPQVISSVPDECIRIIHAERIIDAPIRTEGARAEQVLKQVFGVEPRPAGCDAENRLAEINFDDDHC